MMWQNKAQQLINLEEIENIFTSFYGEENRQLIHEKFSRTSFVFMADNAYIADDAINSSFPKARRVKPWQIGEMVSDIKLDQKNIIKYTSLIDRLGYKQDDILIKNNELRKYTPGHKYNEFVDKINNLASTLPPNDIYLEHNTIEEFQNSHSQLNIESIPHLHDLLESSSSLEDWQENELYEEIYLNNFNTVFNTGFSSISDIKQDGMFGKIINDIEISRKNYLDKRLRHSNFSNNKNLFILSNNPDLANERATINKYSSNMNGIANGCMRPIASNNKLNPYPNEMSYDVLISMDKNTSYSLVLHELTHVLHTNETNQTISVGLYEDENSRYLNEIITEYLTCRMVNQIPDKEYNLPFKKIGCSDYSLGFSIIENFLKTYEPVLKQCQCVDNSTELLEQTIGKEDLNKFTSLVNDYMKIDEIDCLDEINSKLGTNYSSVFEVLNNANISREMFSNSEKITNYLDTIENLHKLDCELSQKQENNISL